MSTDEDILVRMERQRHERMSAVAVEAKPQALKQLRNIPYGFSDDEGEAFVSGYVLGCMDSIKQHEPEPLKTEVAWILQAYRENDSDEPSCAVKAFKDVYIGILEAIDTYGGKEPQFTESIRNILNQYHDDESEHETIVRFYHDMIQIIK